MGARADFRRAIPKLASIPPGKDVIAIRRVGGPGRVESSLSR